jgi:nucleoside-diphosphate-sugar epimerase
LAAVVPVAAADADPVRTFEVNALGTGCVIDAIARRSVDPYVLHCSTSHVYASTKHPLCESDPVEPTSTYGRSKLAAEALASDVATVRNVRLGIARVFSLWAEDQEGSFLYPTVMARLSEAKPGDSVQVTGGNNIRDFLHADDVARLLVELLARKAMGVINVASGQRTSVLDFARSHAPEGIAVESDDVAEPTSIVADTTRLKKLLRG